MDFAVARGQGCCKWEVISKKDDFTMQTVCSKVVFFTNHFPGAERMREENVYISALNTPTKKQHKDQIINSLVSRSRAIQSLEK